MEELPIRRLSAGPKTSFDTATPNNFCVYHYWLGDKDNYPATAPKLSPGKSEPETQAFPR